jgi:hypothetical protein
VHHQKICVDSQPLQLSFVCPLTQANAAFGQVHAIQPQLQLGSFIVRFLAVMKLAASALYQFKTALK